MAFETDRRSLMTMALAGGAVALGGGRSLVGEAHAEVARPAVESPGFYRFALGSFEITAISDGKRAGDGPYPTFGADQSAEAVAALMRENNLPETKTVNGFTPVLVNTGDDLVLFDTGLGASAREAGMGKLQVRLAASGYSADDVTLVVLTHFHGDHIGGLMENGAPAFPKARYAMGRAEFDWWTAADRLSGKTEGNARQVQANVAPLAGEAAFLKEGAEVVAGITAHEAPGHTPGQLIFRLESGGRTLVLTADTANHYVASLQRPDWHVGFDTDKEQAAATRKRVFGMLAADRTPFLGYHMPFPGVGYVEPLGEGFRFVPASYQFDI